MPPDSNTSNKPVLRMPGGLYPMNDLIQIKACPDVDGGSCLERQYLLCRNAT